MILKMGMLLEVLGLHSRGAQKLRKLLQDGCLVAWVLLNENARSYHMYIHVYIYIKKGIRT